MPLPYFYEPGIAVTDTSVTLSEETSKHCVQVLRMKTGAQLHLTDGKGHLFLASVLSADKKHSEVKIEQFSFTAPPERKACIGISLLKNASRLEWLLEKATEIGITQIIPLICHRTEKQHFRFDRMNNILVAAMLQSQQTWLPILHQPVKFEAVLRLHHQQKFIAHCEENEKAELKNSRISNEVLMLIGPEGDFTSQEIQSALQKDYKPVSLGQTRLRTETAGVVAATLLMNL